MLNIKDLLQREAVDALSSLLSQRLRRVHYCVIPGTIADNTTWVRAPHVITGEVALHCDTARVYISWVQNAGWPELVSIRVLQKSLYKPKTLSCIDVSQSSVWRPLLGQALTAVEIWGDDAAPYAVVFVFGKDRVVVAIGLSGEQGGVTVGPGEDILVMSGGEADAREIWSGLRAIWQSGTLV